ncbi:MAG: TonB family protein [Gammaproteobacteria bacterium]|nr:TonB family protein [Gammaproteobacteria bacterium]
MVSYNPSMELMWSVSEVEERRFRSLLAIFLALFVVTAIIAPFIPISKIEREEVERLPPRLAKMILERKKAPPPPPPKPKLEKKEEKPKEPEKPKEKKKEKPKEKKKEKPKEKSKEKPKKKKQTREQARKKAARSGLLAFTDDLADLRETPIINNAKPLTKGSQAAVAKIERSVITSMATRSSGGINTSALGRSTGGTGQLASRATTVVKSDIEVAPEPKRVKPGGKAQRLETEVTLVMERNKGKIFSIYRRALRKNPTLQGRVLLEITIDPDGSVAAAKILSSEIEDKALLKKLVRRVKLFKFGARNVATVTITYPYDFLPGG